MAANHEIFGYTVNFLEELGRGGFGTVYKGHNGTNSEVAIKKVSTATKEDKRRASTEALRFHYLKDEVLQQNEHIVKIHDVKYFQGAVWIVMEYCVFGDLNKFFKTNSQTLKDVEVKGKLMRQIINGIEFLHSKDIVHRDIKPGNILVTAAQREHIIVKLGDFGLSKILDPDSLTSAMSSNVGTLTFKAPEFWDKKPDDKVKYHRNVDVYAAGLTFTAMLQGKPGLVPKAEGPLQHSETLMPIGLAAYSRMVANQPEINVVEVRPTDNAVTRRAKELIQEMTHVSPRNRPSASMVETKLDRVFGIMKIVKHYTLDTSAFFPDALCFLNNQLVIRGHNSDSGERTLHVYTSETGIHIDQCAAQCNHYLPNGAFEKYLIKSMFFSEELLVEGCPHSTCEALRIYNLTTKQVSTGFANVKPHRICPGPPGSLLVCDWKSKALLQLEKNDETTAVTFEQMHKLTLHDCHQVFGMSYIHTHRLVIFSSKFNHQVKGIELSSGNIVWTQDALCSNIPLNPDDISATPGGWICVANSNSLLALDPSDGSYVDTLLQYGLADIKKAVWSGNKLVIRHGLPADQITFYSASLIPPTPDVLLLRLPENS